jgi:hypothetical protein
MLKAADSAILNLQPKPLLKLNPLLHSFIHVAACWYSLLGAGSTADVDAAAGHSDVMQWPLVHLNHAT